MWPLSCRGESDVEILPESHLASGNTRTSSQRPLNDDVAPPTTTTGIFMGGLGLVASAEANVSTGRIHGGM